jgi:hypothetical protein
MLGCNQNITVWIRKKVPEANKEIFVRRVLPVKCKWRNYIERDVNGGAANIYNKVVIVMPYFDDLNELNIKEGDIAALGVCDIEITGISPYTISEIKQLLAPNIMIVKSIALNNSDGMKGQHLRIMGV